ncbi:MAG: potassium channel family protein [Chloroflexota bacterium]
MNVLIVGGGRTGAHLASQLLSEGHQVKIIEYRSEALARLAAELPAETIVPGDGSSPSVLQQAGVQQAGVLVAATGEDENNLVIATLARFEFNVPRIIARVNNPKNAWLFTPEMGVDVGLNQTEILARLIAEEMSMGDMMTLLKLRRGEYALVEEKLPPNARIIGVPLRDLGLPDSCTIAAVIRDGKVITPRGNMIFKAGDEVLAVVDNASRAALMQLLSAP